MSTNRLTTRSILFTLLMVGVFATTPFAKNLVNLRIEPKVGKIYVSLKLADSAKLNGVLEFVDEHADARDLTKRINEIKISDQDDASLTYVVNASPPSPLIAAPHVSWITDTYGLVNLYDVLPKHLRGPSEVRFELPTEWSISSTEQQLLPGKFIIEDPENAVFVVGKGLRKYGSNLSYTLQGNDWQFEDEDAGRMIAEIFKEYSSEFGKLDKKVRTVNVLRFPGSMGNGRWRAETRGDTITIVSSLSNYRNIGEQRLHEQLRHEIFHFWAPGSLALSGEYTWFYEGFARYQSLKVALKLKRIRVVDYINTLSEAARIADRDTSGLSLAELSRERWKGTTGVLDAKGTLLAFVVDMRLLKNGRKRGSADLVRRIFKKFGKEKGSAGVEELEEVFQSYTSTNGIYADLVKGKFTVDWESEAASFGLRLDETRLLKKFEIISKMSRRQRAMLRKLSYNGAL